MNKFQKYAGASILAAMLAGCAAYRDQPLSMKAGWPDGLSRLEVNPSKMPLAELATHAFDPADGLDMTEVAMIAVANNPVLKLARDDAGIASAQAFSAGLLPDPQFGFSPQFPQNGIPGENVTAYDLGLGYNLGALLTHSLKRSAARSDLAKADLVLLWQEWQVVGQARLLFARIVSMQHVLDILEQSRELASLRQAREQTALQGNDLTLAAWAADENAMQGNNRQLIDTRRLIVKDRHALNKLLGLAPGARLNLVGEAGLPALDKREIEKRLSDLAGIRPDLMALQALYKAQDMRLRQAILAQFPAIHFGLVRARDNTGINYEGFSLSLSLPIFNRNRGNIAVARATRRRLRDEFQIRLNQAYGDAEQILSDQKLLETQLGQLNRDIATLSQLSSRADAAFGAGDMSLSAYCALKNSEFSKQIEKNAVMESILEERIALLTTIGGQLKEAK
jgi:outer membrane protein TolC